MAIARRLIGRLLIGSWTKSLVVELKSWTKIYSSRGFCGSWSDIRGKESKFGRYIPLFQKSLPLGVAPYPFHGILVVNQSKLIFPKLKDIYVPGWPHWVLLLCTMCLVHRHNPNLMKDLSGNPSPVLLGNMLSSTMSLGMPEAIILPRREGLSWKRESNRALTSFESLNPSIPILMDFLVMWVKKLTFLLMDWISIICNRKRTY